MRIKSWEELTMKRRVHYMTISFRGDTEVTYIQRDEAIEVTFEQPKYGGFNTLVTDIDGNIIERDGFTNAAVEFLISFLEDNSPVIIEECRGEYV